jgi:hypothetical protein
MRCRNGRRAVDASLYTTHAFPMIVTGFMVVECQQDSSACIISIFIPIHRRRHGSHWPAMLSIEEGSPGRQTGALRIWRKVSTTFTGRSPNC